MSNIYLKVTMEKNFDFLSLKKIVFRLVFAELQLTRISLNFKTRSGSKTVYDFYDCVWF